MSTEKTDKYHEDHIQNMTGNKPYHTDIETLARYHMIL